MPPFRGVPGGSELRSRGEGWRSPSDGRRKGHDPSRKEPRKVGSPPRGSDQRGRPGCPRCSPRVVRIPPGDRSEAVGSVRWWPSPPPPIGRVPGGKGDVREDPRPRNPIGRLSATDSHEVVRGDPRKLRIT